MRAGRSPSRCFRKTTWNSSECSRLWLNWSAYGSNGARARASASIASRSASIAPSGVSKALRQSAKGCAHRRVRRAEEDERVDLLPASARRERPVGVAVADRAAPRIDVRRDERRPAASRAARSPFGVRRARHLLVDVPRELVRHRRGRRRPRATRGARGASANSRSTLARAARNARPLEEERLARARWRAARRPRPAPPRRARRDASRAISSHVCAPLKRATIGTSAGGIAALRVGDALRVAQDEHPSVLAVRDDDRLDRAERGRDVKKASPSLTAYSTSLIGWSRRSASVPAAAALYAEVDRAPRAVLVRRDDRVLPLRGHRARAVPHRGRAGRGQARDPARRHHASRRPVAKTPQATSALPIAADRRAPLPAPRRRGRCRIYASRPFGCRTFFCDRVQGPGKLPRAEVQRISRRIADLSAQFAPRDPSSPRPATPRRSAASRR